MEGSISMKETDTEQLDAVKTIEYKASSTESQNMEPQK